MDIEEFLRSPDVASFLEWARPLTTEERDFIHAWKDGRGHSFECRTLREAYAGYWWRGGDFATNERELSALSTTIQVAARDRDRPAFVDAAQKILRWGGTTRGNAPWLINRTDPEIDALIEMVPKLDPAVLNLAKTPVVPRLNAGFTKIYALMIPDFAIFDSRVAAALAFLIRKYADEAGCATIPRVLRIGLPQGRSGNRRVPGFAPIQPTDWISSNTRCSWLLGRLSGEGHFGELPPTKRLRALEAALFMIGYTLTGAST